jgi:arsenite methyltransferase
MTTTSIQESVREYYGKVLATKKDLKTSACCSADAWPPKMRAILETIEPEILEKFYGCGSPIPPAIDGCVVLDLGCGTGRDAYLAAKLVGPKGRVIGVDMTDEQLEVARRHRDSQMKRFGFDRPNIDFKKGYIEDLQSLGIEDNSVDVVTSNCVINLSPDKRAVFSEIFRVLKPGGELYFSDVFADRRVPAKHRADPVLLGECLAGAMYLEDFRRMMLDLGVKDFRSMTRRKIELDHPEVEAKVGDIHFYSITARAFKLSSLEDQCEDFGQVAYYSGAIEEHPRGFPLDDHHFLETGRPMLVCGNTAAMLQETRFGKYFRVVGDRSRHFGLFPCGPAPAPAAAADCSSGGCC